MPDVRILVVEDDRTIALGVVSALEHERFVVEHVESAEEALGAIKHNVPDLVLCDIMLPGADGLDLMRRIKADYDALPVIMLTARSDEIDRVVGLEMGADDYVTKPFSVREVIARIKARLRSRTPEPRAPTTVEFGDIRVDLRRRILWRGDVEEHLTTHEAGTLGYLIANQGRDISREELLQEVWGYSVSLTTRTVDNQILKLRKKIEDTPGTPRHILTIHGTGYRFEM